MPSSKKHNKTAKQRRGGAFGDTLRRMFGMQPRLTAAQAARIREQRLNAIHPPNRMRTASKHASKSASKHATKSVARSPKSKTAKKSRSPKK